MLMEERFSKIIQLIEKKKSVTVQELVDYLAISESTIRRDLTALDRQGKILKVHGGATAVHLLDYNTKEEDVLVKAGLNKEEKERIGKYAASLIKDNDFVYLDAGTTTGFVIDFLDCKDTLFVTNGCDHGKRLAARGYKTYLLGGELKGATEAVIGSEAVDYLEKYNFTIGFFGANGVSIENGYTTPDVNEAMVKKRAVKRCKKSFVLCDKGKFNKVSRVTFADFDEVQVITMKVNDVGYLNTGNVILVNGIE